MSCDCHVTFMMAMNHPSPTQGLMYLLLHNIPLVGVAMDSGVEDVFSPIRLLSLATLPLFSNAY